MGCRQPDLNSKGAEFRREFDKPMAEDESAAVHVGLKFVESISAFSEAERQIWSGENSSHSDPK